MDDLLPDCRVEETNAFSLLLPVGLSGIISVPKTCLLLRSECHSFPFNYYIYKEKHLKNSPNPF